MNGLPAHQTSRIWHGASDIRPILTCKYLLMIYLPLTQTLAAMMPSEVYPKRFSRVSCFIFCSPLQPDRWAIMDLATKLDGISSCNLSSLGLRPGWMELPPATFSSPVIFTPVVSVDGRPGQG